MDWETSPDKRFAHSEDIAWRVGEQARKANVEIISAHPGIVLEAWQGSGSADTPPSYEECVRVLELVWQDLYTETMADMWNLVGFHLERRFSQRASPEPEPETIVDFAEWKRKRDESKL